jgi:signal transduction histidine kinase
MLRELRIDKSSQNGSLAVFDRAPGRLRPRQIRHAVASWLGSLSLRARLVVLVVLALALVIGATTFWETRTFERALDGDLRSTGQSTAEAVADGIELHTPAPSIAELHTLLHEFIEGVPVLRVITVLTVEGSRTSVLASTSSGDRAEDVKAGQRAIDDQEVVWSGENTLLPRVAVPMQLDQDGAPVRGAVVVTVSLASVAHLRTTGRLLGAGFSIAAIVLATLVIDVLARRLIHRPLSRIRRTMERAGEGDLSARVGVTRRDEIGTIAEGLNVMLAELQHHQVALQERVRAATEELRLRNEEIVQDYHRILSLREALGRAEQMAAVGDMAANVAHQIGTPLNLISGYVQLMKEQHGVDRRSVERLEVIEEQIGRVTAVVRTLLDHSRQPSPRELVNPVELIQRVCALATPRFETAGVLLSVSVPDHLPPFFADAVQLELALLNVMTNGLDAMPDGGSLTVTAGATAHGTWIEIADTGPGIPTALLPRVFEPWLTTKPAGQGTGLGLSIARNVILEHGGSIVATNLPHRGAMFRIDLPSSVRETFETTPTPARVM